jgi:hypothetical protein
VKLSRKINEIKTLSLFRRDWNLLDLRHSYAVNFLILDSGLQDLRLLMGHSKVFDTKRLYGDFVTPSSRL